MPVHNLRRRYFIALAGAAAASRPLASHAQPNMPLVGILATSAPEVIALRLNAFRDGLRVHGYVEGQNVRLAYRWAEASSNRLPELAAELVHSGVAVLVAAGGTASAVAAKEATAEIPIVFGIAADPVALGLVVSLNQPGGNATGVTSMNIEVGPKRLELLHELLPSATAMALLVNPTLRDLAEPIERVSQEAALTLGLQLHVLHASSPTDFDAMFEKARKLGAGAFIIAPDQLFTAHSSELAALSIKHALPTIYEFHQFVAAGGLMSYGSSETEYYRLVGNYAGRVLKGDKPADLPVQQATKIELLINLRTAKALGITVTLPVLGRADEVIE